MGVTAIPYDSNGNFSLVSSYLATSGQTILPSQHNPPFEDVGSALSQVLLRSGIAPMSGNLNMSGYHVRNLSEATNDSDAVPKSQMDAAIAGIEITTQTLVTISSGYAADDDDYNAVFRCTSALTLTIVAAADLRSQWAVEIWAEGGNVTVNPNGSETVNGSTTLIVQKGQRAQIIKSNSTSFRASLTGDPLSGPQLNGFQAGLNLSNSGTDASNDIVVAPGAAAQSATPYDLMQLSPAITKRIDALWAVGNNQGGLDTGGVTSGTYYIWLIQRPDTLVTDVLFSLSSSAPTMPTDYTRRALIGSFTRSSGANGAPVKAGEILNIGVGQTWTSPSRSSNTIYQNTTGRPIQIAFVSQSAGVFEVSPNSSDWTTLATVVSSDKTTCFPIIPPDWYYRTTSGGFSEWKELR